jgi:hypothetical protein
MNARFALPKLISNLTLHGKDRFSIYSYHNGEQQDAAKIIYEGSVMKTVC